MPPPSPSISSTVVTGISPISIDFTVTPNIPNLSKLPDASGNFDKLGMLGVTVKSIDMGDIPVTTVEDMDGLGGGTFKPTLTTMGP